MTVYLDDEAVELSGESLGGVIRAANRRLADRGRIVVEVTLEGQGLGEAELARRQDEVLGLQRLDLRSADPRELALDVLEQVRARLLQVRQEQQEVADLLQQDRPAEALDKFQGVLTGWVQAQQAVLQATQVANVPLDALQVEGRPVNVLVRSTVEALHAVKAALQQRDTVAIADALAYEWPEMADRWDALVAAVMGAVEKGR